MLRHINIYLAQWPALLPTGESITGRGMYWSERKTNLFNDKIYWTGNCQR
jgi:hypothetical protein